MKKFLIVVIGTTFTVFSMLSLGAYSADIDTTQNIIDESATAKNIPTPETPKKDEGMRENKSIKTSEKELSAKIENESKTTITSIGHAPTKFVDFEEINRKTRLAVVNILCTTSTGSISPISGTGIIISESGVIVTNAHVAQYLLLEDLYYDNFIQCVARTGSPAYPTYKLELVYISPDWIKENSLSIKEQNPLGTGEHDFAFLRITKNIDDTVATNISYVKPDWRAVIDIGENTVLVSYPAGFLGGQTIAQNLNLVSAVTKIQDIYTFRDGNVDLIAVGGTVVSQRGSSGGAVMDDDGELIGVISTSTEGDTTSERDLRAITLGYISRTLEKDLGINLEQFVNGDVSGFAKKFQTEEAPSLTKLLTDILNLRN